MYRYHSVDTSIPVVTEKLDELDEEKKVGLRFVCNIAPIDYTDVEGG